MKKIVYYITILICIPFVQSFGQTEQIRSGTSNGAEWISAGPYTTFGMAGQSSVATEISGGTYTGSIGFVYLPVLPVVNEPPVAYGTPAELFYQIGGTYTLEANDPEGVELLYEIVTQSELGVVTTPSLSVQEEVIFTPNTTGILPGVLYHDSFTFKVTENAEEGLVSEFAVVEFSFIVFDKPHEIMSFTKTGADFSLVWDDDFVNPDYHIQMEYFDVPTSSFINAGSVTVDDTAYNLADSNTLDYTLTIDENSYPYLFNGGLVFITLEITSEGGFSDAESYVLDNTDPSQVKVLASSDGLFFAFGSEQTVPENNAIKVQMSAVELGAFDVSQATLQLLTTPANGTLTQPVLVKVTDNLLTWEATYTSTGDVGGLEEIDFSIFHPDRDITESASVSVDIIPVNDPPTLAEIFDQQMLEDGSLDITLNVADPDSELDLSAVANNNADKVSLSFVDNVLKVVPIANYSGLISINALAREIGPNAANNLAVTRSFELEIIAQNDAPVLAGIGNQTTDEDIEVDILLSASDEDGNVLIFDYSASVDNPALAGIIITGSELSVVPVGNATGLVTVTVAADDRSGSTNSESAPIVFTVDFTPVNDQPEIIQQLIDQTVVENFPGYDLDLSAYFRDVETASIDLDYSVSGNSDVLFSFTGSVATITTTADFFGDETITITASDGLLDESIEVLFTVNELGADISIVNLIDDQNLDEDFTTFNIDVSNVFQDSNDLEAIFTYGLSGNNFVITSVDNDNKSITISSAQDVSENETLLLVGTTGGQSSFTQFNLNISSINDAPAIGDLENESIFEDDELTNFLIETSDVDNTKNQLTITAVSDNQDLISDDDILVSFVDDFYYISAAPPANINGTANITVTVSDGVESVQKTFALNVLSVNDNPAQTIATISAGTEDQAYSIDLSTLYSDIDEDVLSFEVANLPGWLVQSGSTLSGTPEDKDTDTLDLTVTALDGNGGTLQNVYELSIGNINDAPEFTSVSNQSIEENATLNELLIGVSDVDTDFSGLTFTATSSDQAIIKDADIELSTVGGFLTITAKPVSNQNGSVDITVTANDGSLTGNTVIRINVGTITNFLPQILLTEIPKATEDALYSESILDEFSDADSDELTISIENSPAWLSLTDGVLSGTPENGDVGSFDITLIVTDGIGEPVSKVFTILIENVNDFPEFLDIEAQTIQEDGELTELLIEVSDVDHEFGDLTFTATSSDQGIIKDTDINVSTVGGLLTVTATPISDIHGITNITVTASDGSLSNDLVIQVTVESVNDLPEIFVNELTATENETYSESIVDSFTDIDGDEIVISLGSSPDWLTITDGVLSGIPTNDDVGTFDVTINVSDGIGDLVSKTISITIENVNDAPVISQAALDVSTNQNDLYEYTIPSDVFSDVDKDDLLTLSMEDGYPSWLTLTGNSLTGTPGYDEIGNYTITITATDTDGLSVTETFDLEVQFVVYDVEFSASNVGVCVGELATVEATGAIDYNWYDVDGIILQEGGTSLEITAIKSGLVIIEGKDDLDRVNPEKVTFDLSLNPNPETPAITEGDALSVPNDSELTYQWYIDDALINDSGATSASYTPEVTGEYYVVATNSSGCSVESGRVVFTTTVSALSFNDFSLKMYPVPVNNELIVQSDLNLSDLRFDVTDVSGKLIPVQFTRNSNQIRFDTSKLSAGVYLMRVFQDDAIIVERFIKN
jgi:hypothetical protein